LGALLIAARAIVFALDALLILFRPVHVRSALARIVAARLRFARFVLLLLLVIRH
jgi:hypothetical protein